MRVIVPLAVACAFLGCATAEKPAENPNDPWVYLPPELGSRIPRKVRLSELGQPSALPTAAVDQRGYEKMQQQTTRMADPRPRGN